MSYCWYQTNVCSALFKHGLWLAGRIACLFLLRMPSLHRTLPHLSHLWQIAQPGNSTTPYPNSHASSYTSYPPTHNLPTVHCNSSLIWTLNQRAYVMLAYFTQDWHSAHKDVPWDSKTSVFSFFQNGWQTHSVFCPVLTLYWVCICAPITLQTSVCAIGINGKSCVLFSTCRCQGLKCSMTWQHPVPSGLSSHHITQLAHHTE